MDVKKATRGDTKSHNSHIVLQLIHDSAHISRAEIVRKTKLTPSTVSKLVKELVENNLVKEVGPGLSGGGKRPTLLVLNETAAVIIGLDLSDKVFCGAILNLRGEILFKVSKDAGGRHGDEAIKLVIDLISVLLLRIQGAILGIGVASQGIINYSQGVIIQAVRLGWIDIPLKQILEEEFNLPVFIFNDSDAAALAEYAFNQKEKVNSLVVIKVSEGVSAGILLDGSLWMGDKLNAGEIGHTVVEPLGILCPCGHYGCLETVATTQVLVEKGREIYRSQPDSGLRALVRAADDLDFSHIQTAFQLGDPYVVAEVKRVASYLGFELAMIIGLLNIQRIFIAGQIAQLGEGILSLINQEISERCLDTLVGMTKVEICSRLEDLTLLGCAAFLLREKLGLV